MPTYELPPALVRMAAERRLIPFLGAGFSAAVGLPAWREMLQAACELIEDGPSFETIERSCGGNLLQMAEYIFIATGNHIGPLRQKIGEVFRTSEIDVIRSGAHVELVNLGAPVVYTTNYDDLIERAHRDLGLACDIVALPRHLALGSGFAKPQVVKYHGDLRYEDTLVLTERSYYRRLDFESPMDLKFRSDLLGRSVLFLGYSFTDINIRVVWHKLMQMMKDVPEQDRPVSWIVRFEEDPVQEALNLAAGIRTIVLGPAGSDVADDRSHRIQAFLLDLSLAVGGQNSASTSSPHASKRSQYVSSFVLKRPPVPDAGSAPTKRRARRMSSIIGPDALRALATRQVPEQLADDVDKLLTDLTATTGVALQFRLVVQAALRAVEDGRFGPGASVAIFRGMARANTRDMVRQAVEDADFYDRPFSWSDIYKQPQPVGAVDALLRTLDSELDLHEEPDQEPDIDVFFCLDPVLRILNGEIAVEGPLPDPLRKDLEAQVQRARDAYVTLADYVPPEGHGPDFEIASRLAREMPTSGEPDQPGWPEEPPF